MRSEWERDRLSGTGWCPAGEPLVVIGPALPSSAPSCSDTKIRILTFNAWRRPLRPASSVR